MEPGIQHPLPDNACDCCGFDVGAYIEARLAEMLDPAFIGDRQAGTEQPSQDSAHVTGPR